MKFDLFFGIPRRALDVGKRFRIIRKTLLAGKFPRIIEIAICKTFFDYPFDEFGVDFGDVGSRDKNHDRTLFFGIFRQYKSDVRPDDAVLGVKRRNILFPHKSKAQVLRLHVRSFQRTFGRIEIRPELHR